MARDRDNGQARNTVGKPDEEAVDQAAGIRRRPTLKTLAEATGLAVTTVSRALKDAPEIAADTRERVQATAERMGYVPDRAAQRLRTGRTNVIAFILSPHEEILGFGTSMITGLTEALRQGPYHLVVMPQFLDQDAEAPVRHIMRNRLADAVVFCRTEPLDRRVKMLLEHDFPFVCHGRTELATPHPFVDYDNFRFAYLAARRLIERGRSNLVLINAPEPFTFRQHMLHGFMSAVRESGVGYELSEAVSIESPPEDIRRFALDRLGEFDADGFVCGGEVSAMAVMAAIADSGRTVGSDADLVAKRTTPIFDQVRPGIDVIGEDLIGAGRKLGDLVLKRIEGAPVDELQWLDPPAPMFHDA